MAYKSGVLPDAWKAYCSSEIDSYPDKRGMLHCVLFQIIGAIHVLADISEIVEDRLASYRSVMPAVCIDDKDVEKLVRLLRSMLVVNHAERPTAQELLCSPWMVTSRVETQ